jgi:DNA-binding Lrp family transcriptional regulator
MKKKLIDAKDIEILNILAEHAELNNKELAARIDLSEGPTLVRVQNLWKRGIIKSFAAVINFQLFGYSKLFLIRVEVYYNDAEELRERFSLNRHIIVHIELEGSVDLVMRIYIGICQAKSIKAAKDELKVLTEGIRGISSATFNQISSMEQKTLHLDDKDLIR